MAHVKHFKMADAKRLANEWLRDDRYKNHDGRIDHSRTHLNYAIDDSYKAGGMMTHRRSTFMGVLRSRLKEVEHSNRKDLNVLSCWVITCPQNLKDDAEKRERFFDLAYEFCQKRYGIENVLNGYVHMDETTPHMHVPIIPVRENRVSSKAVFTRQELSGFHKELESIMYNEFGIKNLVLNGRTKGNYTYKELKERTMRENELAAREAELREYEKALREQQEEYARECHRKDVMLQKKIQEEAARIRGQRIAIAEQEADVEKREAALEKRFAELREREAAVVKREETQRQKEQPHYSDRRRQEEAEARLMRIYENQYGVPAAMSYSEFLSSGSSINGRRMPDFSY